MSQSEKHLSLVELAYQKIEQIVPQKFNSFIEVDLPNSNPPSRVIGNFVPDVLYEYNNLLIIGEAKTIDDFSRHHSQEQFEAYLSNCNNFAGESILVVTVPWELFATAKNYFRRIKLKLNSKVKIIISNEIGRCCEI